MSVKASRPKITRPMRSDGRRRTKSWMTILAASSRLGTRSVSCHRARQIERDDDVDPLQLEVVGHLRALGAGQRHADEDHGGEPQHRRQIAQAGDEAGALGAELGRARIDEEAAPAGRARQARPGRQRHRRRDQRQRERVREAKPLDVAQQREVAGRQRHEHDRDQRVGDRAAPRPAASGWRAARPSAGACQTCAASAAPAAVPAGASTGRVVVTIRIALSSAPRASAALGEILANFTRSQAESHPCDLAQHQLAAGLAAQLRDQLVGGQLQRVEAVAAAQVLADDLGDGEVEGAVVGVLQEAVGAQPIEPLQRHLVRRPRRRTRALAATRAQPADDQHRQQRAQPRGAETARDVGRPEVLLHHRHRRRRVLDRRLRLVGDEAADLHRDRRRARRPHVAARAEVGHLDGRAPASTPARRRRWSA